MAALLTAMVVTVKRKITNFIARIFCDQGCFSSARFSLRVLFAETIHLDRVCARFAFTLVAFFFALVNAAVNYLLTNALALKILLHVALKGF